MEDKKDYIDMIRELRTDNDLSQKQVSKILETTQQHYSSYENRNHEMPICHLITLCEFYNVSADYILGTKVDETKKTRICDKIKWGIEK